MTVGSADDKFIALPPGSIRATSGREFRALLRLIWTSSGRSFGEIAYRSGIGKSQVHNLGAPRLAGVPEDANQVQRYLTCCRLPPAQIALVMDLWSQLCEVERD